MSRLCMRPGCDRDAAARLTYDPVGAQVWLDDLAERVGRHQEICGLHAQRLTVPRGWELSDRRSDEPTMFVPPVASPSPAVSSSPPAVPAPRRRRRGTGSGHPAAQTLALFEVLRQELADAEVAEVAVVEIEVDVVEVEVEPAPEPAVDELPESLQATSPLLARAFAATGHQRSVLTQRGPAAPEPGDPAGD